MKDTAIENEATDLVWGVGAIAKLIGRSYQATQYLLKTKQLPGRLVGRRWVASRAKLIAYLTEVAA